MILRAAACVAFFLSSGATFAAEAKCSLTSSDKAANAKLSFDDFDQKGATPSTWRALEEAGCHTTAIKVAEDYLMKGPLLTPHEKSVVLFHIAQSLAFDGDNARAAMAVAAAMPADHQPTDELDWPAYLVGTRAFLVQDKSVLDAAAAKMAGEPGDRNKIDGDILRGLSMCFDKSYAQAYIDCRPKHPK